MSLGLVTAILILGSIPFVALPFYTARNREQAENSSVEEAENIAEQANIDIFRDQQLQYQQQVDRGEISAEQQAQMLIEAEQLLLNNTAAVQLQRVASKGSLNKMAKGFWLLPVLIFAISLSSLGIYRSLGSGIDQQIAETLAERMVNQQSQVTPALIARIAERVKQRPDNLYYWTILAEDAVAASKMLAASDYFAEALRIQPNEPYLLAQYAQALFFVDANRFSDRVIAALDQAYGADSQNQTVLGLKGIQAFQEADYSRAISYWQGAARGLNPAGDSWKALQGGIQQALQLAGDMPTDSDAVTVNLKLSIAPSIQFEPSQLVFVAIVEADGPPMPLAARKLLAGELPLELTLSDSDVLMAGRSLADKNIRVVARLSSTGSATPQQGDWQVISDVVTSSSADLQFSLEITSPYAQ
ncbi:formate-dependent nitrite reductase complex subunit NrfG [Gammaproteobacteria bacterium MOLA455]|nr:formate-dependent nitrite reductase complex subunit NrfG [Gammaproteobacteria bacterium MOLA455]